MKDDPIVREVREAGQKLFEESGGTMESFVNMLMESQAKRKWPVFRPRSRPSRRKKS